MKMKEGLLIIPIHSLANLDIQVGIWKFVIIDGKYISIYDKEKRRERVREKIFNDMILILHKEKFILTCKYYSLLGNEEGIMKFKNPLVTDDLSHLLQELTNKSFVMLYEKDYVATE